ncbi:MAG: hypothetical protein B6I20_03635 [Bacteroidetes bacterium 4572_117]|nr:MAG: hypothetical protein B6I20_03635 [Bacteroidetes bacterium 4572_117]
MKYQFKKLDKVVVFSKLTRKNYAIFASLHKVVNIVRLSVDICISSLSKNKSILHLFNQETSMDIQEEFSLDKDAILTKYYKELLFSLVLISDIDSHNLRRI